MKLIFNHYKPKQKEMIFMPNPLEKLIQNYVNRKHKTVFINRDEFGNYVLTYNNQKIFSADTIFKISIYCLENDYTFTTRRQSNEK